MQALLTGVEPSWDPLMGLRERGLDPQATFRTNATGTRQASGYAGVCQRIRDR
ncbi:MAG: hypothetical protein JRJ35_18355 [Deltaproteobacteria bacterium]|nr:hypothetical protein [Deltaproteobacteria bacterium]MBW1949464.1 hypothetical protein [Deltaproteobacteria bacterium]